MFAVASFSNSGDLEAFWPWIAEPGVIGAVAEFPECVPDACPEDSGLDRDVGVVTSLLDEGLAGGEMVGRDLARGGLSGKG